MKLRPLSLFVAAVLVLAAAPVHGSQWLKLTAPAPNATLPPLAQTVNFAYAIDVKGFRNYTHSTDPLSTWITVCTGGCALSADIIESHELTASEQTTTSLAVSKIRQHLTQHNLPIDTKIKWNLMFHVAGTFYVNSERQTNSDFYLGHVEAAGGLKVEVKPSATSTPRPSNPPH